MLTLNGYLGEAIYYTLARGLVVGGLVRAPRIIGHGC